MVRALERHEAGTARVIPIILRPVYWKNAPFSKLQALPTGGKSITGREWHNIDEAFANVAYGIHKVVDEIRSQNNTASQVLESSENVKTAPIEPQVANLRRTKEQWTLDGDQHQATRHFAEALDCYEQALRLDAR